MSDYHVLQGSEDGKNYRVVFHIPIPSATNRVGTNYRTAIAAGENQTSVVPDIQAAEQTAITNGEIYEYVESYKTNPAHSNAKDQAALDARFNELKIIKRDELQRKYDYWGFSRDVA